MQEASFHIVLYSPEIPPNTGSIGRLCVATGATLHLIHPLGFRIDEASVKRAGLDYWEHVKIVEYANWDEFQTTLPPNAHLSFFSKKAKNLYWERKYPPGAYFILGSETKGLPEQLISKHRHDCVRIPISDERVRSLNLAQAAGIALYEAIRQNR